MINFFSHQRLFRVIFNISSFFYFTSQSIAVDFDSQTGDSFWHLLSQPHGKKEIKSFMDHVLRQFDSNTFLDFVNSLPPNQKNAEAYKVLQKKFNEHRPIFFFLSKYKALKYQQAVIGNQLAQVLPKSDKAITYLEIGTPGTYIDSIKKVNSVEKTIVINTSKSNQDYIHAISYNPFKLFKSYDKFVSLNDYDPISESDISFNSVDVVTCLIGLHHIPKEKLQNFVNSVYKVLKRDGLFIFRDHDAHHDTAKAIIQAAHTIFNIVSAEVPLTEEIMEYRNFQPLNYWASIVKKSGFSEMKIRLRQDGDPTLNTLMIFKK